MTAPIGSLLTELKDFQYVGSRQIHRFDGRALLADEMGLGKSLQALFYCWKMNRFPALVVCPASLKINWEREASQHLGLLAEVLDGTRVSRMKPLSSCPIIVINYDVLPNWIPYLERLNIKCLIVDEAHYIKNLKSRRYKAVLRIAERIPYVVGISGTPLTNQPAELWPILSIIRPELYTSFLKFAFYYTKPHRKPWGWVYSGARHLDELHAELIKTCMIRRMKKDVLKELPAKVRRVIPMQLPDRREYDDATADFMGWMRRGNLEAARRAKKAEALVKLGYLLRLCAKLKVELIYDWVDNYLEKTDEKLVLFSMHRKMVELLHERYRKISVVVDGSVKGIDRQRAVDRFQHDTKTRIFIGNIRAAGVGLTLTKAPVCAFTDLPWTPGDLVQGEDRIHRIGQSQIATVYYLVAVRTVEEKLCALLRDKQEILENILDGKGEGDNLNIFDELLKSI